MEEGYFTDKVVFLFCIVLALLLINIMDIKMVINNVDVDGVNFENGINNYISDHEGFDEIIRGFIQEDLIAKFISEIVENGQLLSAELLHQP